MKKAYLVLQNGDIFEGYSFGAEGSTVGELVFTTGMCGYIETLTDPSYFGQIVMQTFPLIGNYGFIEDDAEGKCSVSGYIVREWCDMPSNFRSGGDIDAYLKRHGIIGLCGIDTRAVTKIIREHGVMNAVISDSLPVCTEAVNNYSVKNAVKSATCKETSVYKANNEKYKVVLYDYGAKENIIRELLLRGCTVIRVPSCTAADEVLKLSPDGIMLSNGPGDPAENTGCIKEIKKLLGAVPMFGICLGHQLMALAAGGKTEKMRYGHRGVNQPVKEVGDSRTYITSQNHGYSVIADSIKDKGSLSFVNANDGTCEGVDYKDLNAFSVQFHPEACSGPKDTSFLFDKFIKLMEER